MVIRHWLGANRCTLGLSLGVFLSPFLVVLYYIRQAFWFCKQTSNKSIAVIPIVYPRGEKICIDRQLAVDKRHAARGAYQTISDLRVYGGSAWND